jgi:hypothetical protein
VKVVVVGLAAVVALGACRGDGGSPRPTAAPSSPPSPSAAVSPDRTCGPTTPLERVPGFEYAVRLGPFALLGSSSPNGPSRITRSPSKVVFSVVEPYDVDYELTGFRCDDGEPLAFWYGHEAPVPRPSRTPSGDPSALLPAAPHIEGPGRLGRGGYLLLTTPGRWRLDLSRDGVRTDSVVIDVVYDI